MRKEVAPEAAASPVVRALAQRGLSVLECSPEERTFLPLLRSRKDRRAFYDLLRSYAFRLFLRDILALRDRFLPERLGPFFTPESVEHLAGAAERLGIIRRAPGNAILLKAAHVTDFGDTFEWFVAETLRDQFLADASWGVKIAGLPCGGDFDVLALVCGKLLYVETKTSPPKHIEPKEVEAFLRRVRTLAPDVAVFLSDTHLRMKDKLVPLMDEALGKEGARKGSMRRVEKETFSWENRLFLTNARRDVGSNLALCLRRYFLGGFFG